MKNLQILDKILGGRSKLIVYDLADKFVKHLSLLSDVFILFRDKTNILKSYMKFVKQANNKYRSRVYGLCGTFTSQPRNDFTTPQGCVLQNPFEFATAYALNNNSCQSPSTGFTVKDESYDTVSGYARETNNTLIPKPMKSSPDATPKPTSKSGSRSQLRRKNTQHSILKPLCSEKYVRTVDKEGKRCVSLSPQLQCYKRCSKQKSVKKQVI